MRLLINTTISRHFGSYTPGKQRGTPHKGRNSAVKFNQLSWAGQYNKCAQYDFKFTSVYSDILDFFSNTVFIIQIERLPRKKIHWYSEVLHIYWLPLLICI